MALYLSYKVLSSIFARLKVIGSYVEVRVFADHFTGDDWLYNDQSMIRFYYGAALATT